MTALKANQFLLTAQTAGRFVQLIHDLGPDVIRSHSGAKPERYTIREIRVNTGIDIYTTADKLPLSRIPLGVGREMIVTQDRGSVMLHDVKFGDQGWFTLQRDPHRR
jgi:hypothetical protein